MAQDSMDVIADWVEIIEPTSKEQVFTNRTTGEILLSPPPGVAVKPMSQNQWWELLDSNSKCLYYYNPHTEQTVWDKPGDLTADIISFTKLQTVPVDEEDLDHPTNVDLFDPSESAPATSQQKTPEPISDPELTKKTSPSLVPQTPPSSSAQETREGSSERKVSDIFAPPQQLGRLSPMNLFNDTRFSFVANPHEPTMDNGTTTHSTQHSKSSPTRDTNHVVGQKGHQKLSKAMSSVDGSMGRDEKCMTLDSAMLKNRSQHTAGKKARDRLGSSAAGPAPPPPASKVAAKPSTPMSPEKRGGASSSAPNSAPPVTFSAKTSTVSTVDGPSKETDPAGQPSKETNPAGQPSKETDPAGQPSKETEPRASGDDQMPTAPTRKKKAASVDHGIMDVPLPVAHKTVKISDPKSPDDRDKDIQPLDSEKGLAPPVPSPSDSKPVGGAAVENKTSGIPTEQRSVRKSLHHHRAKSDYIPAPPPAPALMSSRASTIDRTIDPSVAKAVESIGSFENLAQHKKGLFRKKVTIHNMLSWTKDPIKEPMIMTRDKQTRKDAVDIFKMILQFMGDRKPKKDSQLTSLDIVTRGWENKNVRDEIYIQLCRQTSANDKPSSLKSGWELFTICLAFFPPTVKFRSYLEGYLYKHITPSEEHLNVPVEVYALYCHKKVEKMTQMGAKKGLKKPTLEEVIRAKDAPFNPSMFGMALEEILDMESARFPDRKGIPWVVEVLVETVLRLDGPRTEGIFRVPGDIDEVNSLLLHVDKGLPPPDALTDPHIPASLLKLWFRELEEPLIPESYYQECVDNYDKRPNAISLVRSLPDRNRELLLYIIRFLRKFITPDNIEITKMTLDNIAMVWAPNFLRCPSEDHALIFQNTKKEMGFLRLLLKYVETEATAGGSEIKEAMPSDS